MCTNNYIVKSNGVHTQRVLQISPLVSSADCPTNSELERILYRNYSKQFIATAVLINRLNEIATVTVNSPLINYTATFVHYAFRFQLRARAIPDDDVACV